MSEQANFSELRNKISNWDLEAEEMLINKMKIFTNSYKCDFADFSKNMQSFSNNLINTEVQSYKAISNLKELSMNRFIEETLEENPESVSEGSESGNETGEKKIINDNEKMKITLDMSMKAVDEINAQKEKNKEKIEDDNVSVASKKFSLDNSKKYGNIPFIIGTENFMKDNNIGLTDLKDEEEDEKEEEIEVGKEKQNKNKDFGDWEVIDFNDEKNNKNSNDKNINKKISNDLNEIKEQVKVPIENENDKNLGNKSGNLVVVAGKGPGVPPPPPPPPFPDFNSNNNQKIQKVENKYDNKKQKEEINIQKENKNIKININKKINPDIMNSLLFAGLKNIKDDDEDDDGDLFSRKYRKIPDNNINIYKSQIPMFSPQNNLIKNINNNINNNDNKNNKININNNMTINKEKLNDLFGEDNNEDNEEDQKIIEEKEEDNKIKKEKSNELNFNILEEQKTIKSENIFVDEMAKEEEEEKIKAQKKENDSQQIMMKVPKEKENLLNIKKNKTLSLFEEEEKNNSEVIKPIETQKNQIKSNNLKKFIWDDDE